MHRRETQSEDADAVQLDKDKAQWETPAVTVKKQEVVGTTNRLLSFDTTRTA
jgi:hypothetical protein